MATSGRGSGLAVTVDIEHHLIVAHEVTNSGSSGTAYRVLQQRDVSVPSTCSVLNAEYFKRRRRMSWSDEQRQKRAVAEYLAGLEAEEDKDNRGGGSDGTPPAKPDCE